MDEKRLQEIDRRVNAIRYVFNGWDMVPLTIAEANELTTEIRKLREALAFYGDKASYRTLRKANTWQELIMVTGDIPINKDDGAKARIALGLEHAPETPQD